MSENRNNSVIKVLIVDDHDLVRYGFKSLLGANDGIEVIDTLSSGEEAINWCRDNKGHADVILMDVNMPGIGGIEATHLISKSWPVIPQSIFSRFAYSWFSWYLLPNMKVLPCP